MNEENQVEIMEEEGSALSDELLNAINEDWDTDVLPGDIRRTRRNRRKQRTAGRMQTSRKPKSRRTRPLKRRLSRKKPRRKQTSLS